MNETPFDQSMFQNIAVVDTAERFFTYQRSRAENIVVMPRRISGDFNGLSRWLLRQAPHANVLVSDGMSFLNTAFPLDRVRSFKESPDMQWKEEIQQIIGDMELMQRFAQAAAELRVVRNQGYHPSTYVFHKDGGEFRQCFRAKDRIMCAYNRPTTEWIAEGDARKVRIAGGSFHMYEKKDGAPAYRFSPGDMWRQACLADYGDALIHRAVEVKAGDPPRLLVVC